LTKCIDICRPNLTTIIKRCITPAEPRFFKQSFQNNVSQYPGMSAIAIGKGMNLNQAMMKSGGNLQVIKCSVFDPVAGIIEQIP